MRSNGMLPLLAATGLLSYGKATNTAIWAALAGNAVTPPPGQLPLTWPPWRAHICAWLMHINGPSQKHQLAVLSKLVDVSSAQAVGGQTIL
jgi:hypothetical protein